MEKGRNENANEAKANGQSEETSFETLKEVCFDLLQGALLLSHQALGECEADGSRRAERTKRC